MIVSPKSKQEYLAMATFLSRLALVQPTPDMQFVGWVDQNKLRICVGINAFLGKTCQIHVAFEPEWTFTPKTLMHAVFRYVFVTRDRELLIGIVNSNNEKAMKYDLHLGFSELYRIPKLHDDGGDIVILGMRKSECRYLKSEEAA